MMGRRKQKNKSVKHGIKTPEIVIKKYVNPNIIDTNSRVKIISEDEFQTFEAIKVKKNDGLITDKYWLISYRVADGSIYRGFVDSKSYNSKDIIQSTNGISIPTKVKTKKEVLDILFKLEGFDVRQWQNFKYVEL